MDQDGKKPAEMEVCMVGYRNTALYTIIICYTHTYKRQNVGTVIPSHVNEHCPISIIYISQRMQYFSSITSGLAFPSLTALPPCMT